MRIVVQDLRIEGINSEISCGCKGCSIHWANIDVVHDMTAVEQSGFATAMHGST